MEIDSITGGLVTLTLLPGDCTRLADACHHHADALAATPDQGDLAQTYYTMAALFKSLAAATTCQMEAPPAA